MLSTVACRSASGNSSPRTDSRASRDYAGGMTSLAVVPGSFDPVTLGHLDVVERARNLFDEVHVVVVHNPNKSALLPVARRVELIEASLAEAGIAERVTVTSWSVGLLVDYCQDVGATAIVKGIRTEVDVTYETPMAIVNRDLAGIETVFVLPNPAHSHVSSSLVRQVAGLGGDVSPYVPAAVSRFMNSDEYS